MFRDTMKIRRVCIICDKYFTPQTQDINETYCGHCAKEAGDVKSATAERVLNKLKEQFKKE